MVRVGIARRIGFIRNSLFSHISYRPIIINGTSQKRKPSNVSVMTGHFLCIHSWGTGGHNSGNILSHKIQIFGSHITPEWMEHHMISSNHAPSAARLRSCLTVMILTKEGYWSCGQMLQACSFTQLTGWRMWRGKVDMFIDLMQDYVWRHKGSLMWWITPISLHRSRVKERFTLILCCLS